jgi:DNA polymerase III delta prime subunit
MDIWVFKHEPSTLEDMILTEAKRNLCKEIIQQLPNTLIAGSPGTGKSTFMNVLKKTTGIDWLKINGSEETGIDTVREKIKSFATSYSKNKKIVYINEADRISANAQNSLNQIIEDVQSITRFFLVCNNVNRITSPILSRCSFKVDFNDPPATDIFHPVMGILKKEKVTVANKKAIVGIIKKLYPDIRQIIETVRSNVKNNTIEDISFGFTSDLFNDIIDAMLKKDIEAVRKFLKSNYIDYAELYHHLYKEIMDGEKEFKKPAEIIIKTGEFLYKNEIVLIKEINFMAFFMELLKQDVL